MYHCLFGRVYVNGNLESASIQLTLSFYALDNEADKRTGFLKGSSIGGFSLAQRFDDNSGCLFCQTCTSWRVDDSACSASLSCSVSTDSVIQNHPENK